MVDGAPDDLVVIASTATPFEAHTLATVLNDAGVEAVVMGTTPWSGMPLDKNHHSTVQVRRELAERAKLVLEANVADSVDIDWDEVNLGEREDDLPLSPVGRTPMPARVGLWVAMIIAIAIVLGAVVLLFRGV